MLIRDFGVSSWSIELDLDGEDPAAPNALLDLRDVTYDSSDAVGLSYVYLDGLARSITMIHLLVAMAKTGFLAMTEMTRFMACGAMTICTAARAMI